MFLSKGENMQSYLEAVLQSDHDHYNSLAAHQEAYEAIAQSTDKRQREIDAACRFPDQETSDEFGDWIASARTSLEQTQRSAQLLQMVVLLAEQHDHRHAIEMLAAFKRERFLP
ncbi:MAG: hypothetical protein ACRCWJ_14960 [Casimicrobium sp.]